MDSMRRPSRPGLPNIGPSRVSPVAKISTALTSVTWDADVLEPSAVGEVLTRDNASHVRASIIVEAANAPTTPDASEILDERGVTDCRRSTRPRGGVTVSYYEWLQNVQRFRWDLDRVRDELAKTMHHAYGAVTKVAKAKDLDLRTDAFVLAIQRVGRAGLSRGHVSKPIDLS